MESESGVLYIATGEKYLKQAFVSAKTVKEHTNLPIAVVSDRPIEHKYFDHVIVADDPEGSFADKPKYICESPFKRTLYIDTDVFFLDDVTELLEMLDTAEIAAAVDPYEWELRYKPKHSFDNVPDSIPIFQTGVVAFKNTPTVDELFSEWNEIQENTSIERDQASFRIAIYRNNVQYISFSHHYNCPIGWPIHAVGDVKVLHSHQIKDLSHLKKIANRINESDDLRYLYGHAEGVSIYMPTSGVGNLLLKAISTPMKKVVQYRWLAESIIRSLKVDGVTTTINKFVRDDIQ